MYRSHDHLRPVEAARENHHVDGLQRVRSLIATARSFEDRSAKLFRRKESN